MPEALLTNRAVVLAKIESSYNVDPTPTPTADAILVEQPDYSLDVNVLQRNLVRFDLDQMPGRNGRKLASMKFSVEWRSNGLSNAGAIPPKLGRLLRGCGFAEVAIASAGVGQVGAINGEETNTSPTVVWTPGGTQAGLTQPVKLEIEVTTGGASGAAKFKITPDAQSVAAGVDTQQTNVTATSGSPIQLKNGGGALTLSPAWTGNLVLGDKWTVWIYPLGFTYMPVSASFESLTLYMYYDGVLHKLTGARGTFQMSGDAGGYAKATFTFTGQYVPTTDAAIPTTALFEQTLPAVVELSQLYHDTIGAVVSSFGVDVGIKISPRIDANSSDGYNGVRITGRDVKGSIDPEMTLVADYDWWGKMAAGATALYRNKVGQVAGNRIWTLCPATQMQGPSYKDRDQIRALDVPLKMNRRFGNDSVIFVIS